MENFSKEERSYVMSRVKSKDTAPELLIRKSLHRLGLRYKLHDPKLDGKPDLVFPKYHAVIFIHGCFWHGHNCGRTGIPKNNREFWTEKIERNRKNDNKHTINLIKAQWRTLIVWECAIQGKNKIKIDDLVGLIRNWLLSAETSGVIQGRHLS
jgi:DNA mismatch endonuclease (patch repair protein)